MRKANNLASRLAVADVLGPNWCSDADGSAAAPEKRSPPAVDTALPPLPAVEEPDHWHAIGRVEGQYRVDPQDAFAVLQLGPYQYKVTADDVILHPKLIGTEVNDVLALGKVLLVGTRQVGCCCPGGGGVSVDGGLARGRGREGQRERVALGRAVAVGIEQTSLTLPTSTTKDQHP